MKNRKKTGFTLIELIVVIAIIGLLAGMLLPALSGARNAAKKTRARAEVDQIKTAWLSYLQEYHKFPETAITEMNAEAIEILCGDDTALAKAENPQRIIFLDFQQDQSAAFYDPWSKEDDPKIYYVALDVDGDDSVNVNGEDLPLTVAVWSSGPDGTLWTGDDIQSWK